MRRFLGAAQFLTTLPISLAAPVALSQTAPAFPIIGALLGALAGSTLNALRPYVGAPLAALLAIGILVVLTGGLHEDGLADIADACRAGRSRETMLRILKDSRIGTYGALALIISILMRAEALARSGSHAVLGVTAALALSRSALVALAGFTPSFGEGLGAAFSAGLTLPLVWTSIVLAVAIATLAAQGLGLIMILVTTATVIASRMYFLKRLGGVNGDCLGAACQIAEAGNLLVLACQLST